MKPVLIVAALAASLGAALGASAASAHPGHVAEIAGHAHWIEYAAYGLGGLVVALLLGRALLRARRGGGSGRA